MKKYKCMIHTKTPFIAIWTTKLKAHNSPESNLKIHFHFMNSLTKKVFIHIQIGIVAKRVAHQNKLAQL